MTERRPILGVSLMAGSALCVCIGQLLWKLGATHGVGLVVIGLVCYAIGALLMLVAYRFGELSVLQPILGLSYALSLIAGWYWLGEHVSVLRIIGVITVVLGVTVLARGSATPADRRSDPTEDPS